MCFIHHYFWLVHCALSIHFPFYSVQSFIFHFGRNFNRNHKCFNYIEPYCKQNSLKFPNRGQTHIIRIKCVMIIAFHRQIINSSISVFLIWMSNYFCSHIVKSSSSFTHGSKSHIMLLHAIHLSSVSNFNKIKLVKRSNISIGYSQLRSPFQLSSKHTTFYTDTHTHTQTITVLNSHFIRMHENVVQFIRFS